MYDLFLEKYQNLNNSFEKTCVFHVGYDAGFFSEINMMLAAMAYCLQNKIKFELYSDTANFAPNNGWEEYFLPFCKKRHGVFLNKKYNKRTRISPFRKWQLPFVKKIFKIDYMTFEVFEKFCPKYEIPELDINATNYINASKGLAKMIWRFNPETKTAIDEIINSIDLPKRYAGIQIRRGDKLELENQKTANPDTYMRILRKEVPEIKDIVVFCDDYGDFEYFKNKYEDYNFVTLCEKSEKGYIHTDFEKLSWNVRRKAQLNLFANIEILKNSDFCIGTTIANPSLFLRSIMDEEKFIFIEMV